MSAKFGMSSTIPISTIKIPDTARTAIPTIPTGVISGFFAIKSVRTY